MSILYTSKFKNENNTIIKTLVNGLKFLLINFILAFILLCLAIEEAEWAIYSSTDKLKSEVIDNSSWNIIHLFLRFSKDLKNITMQACFN